MSTTVIPDRFTTQPDEHALQTADVAQEEHGSVSRSPMISMPRARRC
jgi:hypothetical protein